MATNELERAVIDAAREAIYDDSKLIDLYKAVRALDAFHAQQAPQVTERGWHEVCEGDELMSVKNGQFYPVVKTLKVRKGHEITIKLNGAEKTIVRPIDTEPSATVRRGATGDAMDLLTSVFSSGGN